jgi:hypothetical protein
MQGGTVMHRRKRNAAHVVVLALALLMSLTVHHSTIGAQLPASHHPTAVASTSSHDHTQCSDHVCGRSHDAIPGCCAMGVCMGDLAATGNSFLPLGHVIRHDNRGTEIGARWTNEGLDRPPKAS